MDLKRSNMNTETIEATETTETPIDLNRIVEIHEIEERCEWFIDMLKRESEGEYFCNLCDKNDFKLYKYKYNVMSELKRTATIFKDIYQEEDDEVEDVDVTKVKKNKQKLNDMVNEILSDGFEVNYEFYIRYKSTVDIIMYHILPDIIRMDDIQWVKVK